MPSAAGHEGQSGGTARAAGTGEGEAASGAERKVRVAGESAGRPRKPPRPRQGWRQPWAQPRPCPSPCPCAPALSATPTETLTLLTSPGPLLSTPLPGWCRGAVGQEGVFGELQQRGGQGGPSEGPGQAGLPGGSASGGTMSLASLSPCGGLRRGWCGRWKACPRAQGLR